MSSTLWLPFALVLVIVDAWLWLQLHRQHRSRHFDPIELWTICGFGLIQALPMCVLVLFGKVEAGASLESFGWIFAPHLVAAMAIVIASGRWLYRSGKAKTNLESVPARDEFWRKVLHAFASVAITVGVAVAYLLWGNVVATVLSDVRMIVGIPIALATSYTLISLYAERAPDDPYGRMLCVGVMLIGAVNAATVLYFGGLYLLYLPGPLWVLYDGCAYLDRQLPRRSARLAVVALGAVAGALTLELQPALPSLTRVVRGLDVAALVLIVWTLRNWKGADG